MQFAHSMQASGSVIFAFPFATQMILLGQTVTQSLQPRHFSGIIFGGILSEDLLHFPLCRRFYYCRMRNRHLLLAYGE
jgi:hypothetical protein